MTSLVLVLAGGGVAGIAWEVGIVMGLADHGVYVRDADLMIGTSAGSAVAAQLRSDADLESLFAAQVAPETKEISVELDLAKFARWGKLALDDAELLRKQIGAIAREPTDYSEEQRREIVAARLPSPDWPRRPLWITAVDTESGELVVFDADSGVPLVDAVAASCAVPAVWPAVTIGDRRYMDGGMRSTTNADLAKGHERVLVVAPFDPQQAGHLGSFADERSMLEDAGSAVEVIVADEASSEAMGANPLDASIRAPAAHAGRAQGRTVAAAVEEFWTA